jgi:hypothetical protein
MSILNVNQIQPVGSGQTVTISATNIDTGSATFTGGSVGIGTDNPSGKLDVDSTIDTYLNVTTSNNGSGAGIVLISNNNNEFVGYANSLRFGTVTGKNAAGFSEKIRFTSGGNVQIANGNLVFSTSGTGIDFSAASGSAAGSTSALLDDYEEGTFTPTDVGGGGLTFTTALGHYVKIGNIVNVQIRVKWPTTSNTSSARVSLPFTGFNPSGANVSDGATAGAAGYISGGSVIPQIHTSGSSAEIYFYNFGGQMNNSNFSGLELRFGIVYRTS